MNEFARFTVVALGAWFVIGCWDPFFQKSTVVKAADVLIAVGALGAIVVYVFTGSTRLNLHVFAGAAILRAAALVIANVWRGHDQIANIR